MAEKDTIVQVYVKIFIENNVEENESNENRTFGY